MLNWSSATSRDSVTLFLKISKYYSFSIFSSIKQHTFDWKTTIMKSNNDDNQLPEGHRLVWAWRQLFTNVPVLSVIQTFLSSIFLLIPTSWELIEEAQSSWALLVITKITLLEKGSLPPASLSGLCSLKQRVSRVINNQTHMTQEINVISRLLDWNNHFQTSRKTQSIQLYFKKVSKLGWTWLYHAFNPSIQQTKAGIFLWVQVQLALHCSEIQDSRGYKEKPSLKQTKNLPNWSLYKTDIVLRAIKETMFNLLKAILAK